MSNLLDSAIKKLYSYVDQRIDSVRPFRAIVIGQSNGMVQIRRLTDTGGGETVLNARVAGFDIATNDEVLVVQVPNWPTLGARSQYVIVGPLQRSAPTSHTISPRLLVKGVFDDASATGYGVSAGAALGSSPGAVTQTGNEYCGRLIQTTGSSGLAAGILWTVTFVNPRPTSNYNVFLDPQNADSAAVNPYAVNDSNTQFTIRCQTAPGAAKQMRIGWWIVQR